MRLFYDRGQVHYYEQNDIHIIALADFRFHFVDQKLSISDKHRNEEFRIDADVITDESDTLVGNVEDVRDYILGFAPASEMTPADVNVAIASAITTHEAGSNPHDQYKASNQVATGVSTTSPVSASGTDTLIQVFNKIISSIASLFVRPIITPYSGVTNASGNYTVVFASAYPVAPNIQVQIVGGTAETFHRVTAISTTGFTVNVFTRGIITSLPIVGILTSSLLGGTITVLNGAAVDVVITPK